jgi:signal peptidase I
MNIDFLLVLVYAVMITGLISLVDHLFFAKKRQPVFNADGTPKYPIVVDYCRSLFPLLVIVLLIRSFIFQPYKVPSGSLEPTIVPGDLIAVSMFKYGMRLPLNYQKILNISNPKTGDIMLFRWPPNFDINLIKRVIGLPGDHISYIHKVLYINGKEAKQTFIADAIDRDYPGQPGWPVKKIEEDLNGVKHQIYINPNRPDVDFYDLVVPPNSYFMMGDNRDNSDDSRYWGFVPAANIIGQGFGILFSWDSETHSPRWDRIAKKL